MIKIKCFFFLNVWSESECKCLQMAKCHIDLWSVRLCGCGGLVCIDPKVWADGTL